MGFYLNKIKNELVIQTMENVLQAKNSVVDQLNAKSAQEWLSKRKEMIKPWSEFLNTNSFRKPISTKQWSRRAVKNVEMYQTNYLFVFVGLIFYAMPREEKCCMRIVCLRDIITSPLLLIAILVFFIISYIISTRPADTPLKVFGHEVSTTQQYALAALCSFPLFFLAGAGSAVFWVLGVSFFLVCLHASFHISAEEGTSEEGIPFTETV